MNRCAYVHTHSCLVLPHFMILEKAEKVMLRDQLQFLCDYLSKGGGGGFVLRSSKSRISHLGKKTNQKPHH